MKRILFLLYIGCISSTIVAGNRITGMVSDHETNTRMEFVNIQLLTTDSVFVKGV